MMKSTDGRYFNPKQVCILFYKNKEDLYDDYKEGWYVKLSSKNTVPITEQDAFRLQDS